MSALDVEPRGVEIGCLGNSSDGSFFGVPLAVAALKDTFQYAAVFAVPRPKEFAILVLAKPVDVENLRELRSAGASAHPEPVRKVVAHVVAAKCEHGHGIAAKLSHFSRNGGGGLAAYCCTQKSTVLPIESFCDEGDNSGAPSAEQDGIDGDAVRIFPLGRDYGALTRGTSKPCIRVRCL